MTTYEEDLKIDLNKLEEEWLKQPTLYMKYAEMVAQSQRERDKAKEQIELARAELDSMIRENPDRFSGCPQNKDGSYKPTEGWISSVILNQDKYKKVSENFHDLNYNFNVLQGALKAFDHRKKALEMESQLWLGGYWSTPKEKGSEMQDRAVQKSSDKQREGLRRRS